MLLMDDEDKLDFTEQLKLCRADVKECNLKDRDSNGNVDINEIVRVLDLYVSIAAPLKTS